MEFRFLSAEDYPRWDDFVDRSPQGSLYAKSFYLSSIGCRFRIGAVLEGDQILAGMPLTRNELGVNANPLFVKYLGVLQAPRHSGTSDASEDESYAVERLLIDHLGPRRVWSFSFHPAYHNWLPFYWRGFRQTTAYTYQIAFTEGGDFRSRYGEKVNGPLRAARRNGLVVGPVEHREVARLNRLTYEGRGTAPPFSDERLVGILDRLSEHRCVYARGVRDAAGALHAAAVAVYDAGSANLIIDGSDPRHRKAGSNTLLVDHMIEFASTHCRLFDFEGSMHERIARFYRGFGGRAIPYSVIRAGNLATAVYLGLLDLYKRLRYS